MTTIAPWLSVADATAAVEFYQRALGAEVVEGMDDAGVVIVAQLRIEGGAEFWVSIDEDPAPGRRDRFVRMIVNVTDPDAWYQRAVGAGALSIADVHEEHGWRTGRVEDPSGHHWEFARISR